MDSAMSAKGHNMASLRADAVRRSIKELEVIDRLIERQFKNMRLLMQSYESVRFAPQLLKKMTLEIQQLEQRIEGANEHQRREVSRQ
jgi:predicted ribosome quality control (RQC) complex YloA/Tae2 family protein